MIKSQDAVRVKRWAEVAGWVFIAAISVLLLWQLPGVLQEGRTRFGQPAPFYYVDLVSWALIIGIFLSLGRGSQASTVLVLTWLILILASSAWEYKINYISSGRLAVRIIGCAFVALIVLRYFRSRLKNTPDARPFGDNGFSPEQWNNGMVE